MKKILYTTTLFILLAACNGKLKEEPMSSNANGNTVTLTAAQLLNAGIESGKMEQKEISSILRINGKIDVPPQNMVSISIPLGGYLKTTKLLPGMHVAKGEVIAVMEDQQYIQLQQDFLTAKARILFLEKEYNRQKDLNESQSASDKAFQQAEADYRTQRILVASLTEKLKLAGINIQKLSDQSISKSINIHSPIDGFVTKVNVNIGKYVSPTEVLFELVDPSDIHLALKVFEKDVDKLYIGQKVIAFTNNQPGIKHGCDILLIGKNLSVDGYTEVHCHFDSYDKLLIPGTYMNAEIEVKSKKSFVLPEEAVVRFENKQYVFTRQSEKEFEMTGIVTGNVENGYIEVLEADNIADKQIVLKGAYTLLMALKNSSEEE